MPVLGLRLAAGRDGPAMGTTGSTLPLCRLRHARSRTCGTASAATPGRCPVNRTTGATIEREGGTVALLAAMLRGRPSLPGALCRGQAPAFDRDRLDGEEEDAYRARLTASRSACAHCPERSGCPRPV